MRQCLRWAVPMCLTLGSVPAFPVDFGVPGAGWECDRAWLSPRLAAACEVREQWLPAGEPLTLDGLDRGDVQVHGWSGSGILIRSHVRAAGDTSEAAESHARSVKVEAVAGEAGQEVKARGPAGEEWAVDYEVFVPHHTPVAIRTGSGRIAVTDTKGRLDFTANNGEVSLRRIGGRVRGRTANGSVSIDLTGTQWRGEGLDVTTGNGRVRLQVPRSYRGRIQTATVNGRVRVRGLRTASRRWSGMPGGSGATVRATTENGPVEVMM